MNNTETNGTMKYKRIETGHYIANINGNIIDIEGWKNEWHLKINNKWHGWYESLKNAKFTALDTLAEINDVK